MVELINIAKAPTYTITATYTNISIAKTNPERNNILAKGIRLTPQWTDIVTTRSTVQMINKDQVDGGVERIEKDLVNGNYYLNVSDYSDHDLIIACGFLIKTWNDQIWSAFLKNNDHTITLKDEKILKLIIEKNQELFTTEEEFRDFCMLKSIEVNDFIVPAKFSVLNMTLKEIGVRLESEPIYRRRKLFTESLIQKIKSRQRELQQYNKLSTAKIEKLQHWMETILGEIKIISDYKENSNSKNSSSQSNVNHLTVIGNGNIIGEGNTIISGDNNTVNTKITK